MTRQPKVTRDTVEGAMVLIGEWNAMNVHKKTAFGRVTIDDAAGQAMFRQALESVARLEGLARSLRSVAVCECNGTWPNGVYLGEEGSATLEKQRVRLEARARETVKGWSGVSLILGGDVRGSQVRIATPKSQRHNTWGGAESGWAL